ncbi:hypothetical protein D1007_29400 [Hordeum vulgare]|nr:hypothetical protein D1007_29400 [Hordeum vulgare]
MTAIAVGRGDYSGMGRTCVYVHHVDKDAFLKGNIDPDPDEFDMVFDLCPSYAIPATINEEANIEPLSCVYEANEEVNIEHEPLVEANYEHYDDGNVLHDNNLGDLDKYNLQETMDHSIPYSRGYASESDDEGPDEEVDEEGFTAKEAEAFTNVLKRDHRTPLFEDLNLADEAVVDGGEGILFGVRPPSHRDTHGKNIILPGSKFETFFELKMWLDEYSVTHYRPHKVVHSNMKLRYTVACEDRGCPWIVRARPWKGGPGWNIVSCMPHMCRGKRVDGALSSQSHRQLTSEFIAYRLSNSISSLPTMSIKSVQDLVKALFHYEVKYDKAWKAKQAAFKMLYGDWEEAYNRIPRYGRFSTEQGKSGVGEEKDAASEEQLLMERAAKKLREEDAAEARKKKDEEHKAKMDEEWQMFLEHKRYEARIKENDRKTLEKRKKEYEPNFKKMLAEAAAKREREHQRFTERVKEEASKLCKREEEEEEERKKKKGKGPCSTQ